MTNKTFLHDQDAIHSDIANKHVSVNSGDDSKSGSPYHPFRTIQHALDEISGGAIHVLHGTYTEDLTVNNSPGMTLMSQSVSINPSTTVNGTLTVSGTSGNVRVGGLSFSKKTTLSAGGLANHFDSCHFETSEPENIAIDCTEGTYYFTNCNVDGVLKVSGTQPCVILFLTQTDQDFEINISNPNAVVLMKGLNYLKKVTNTNGTVKISPMTTTGGNQIPAGSGYVVETLPHELSETHTVSFHLEKINSLNTYQDLITITADLDGGNYDIEVDGKLYQSPGSEVSFEVTKGTDEQLLNPGNFTFKPNDGYTPFRAKTSAKLSAGSNTIKIKWRSGSVYHPVGANDFFLRLTRRGV